VKGSGQEEVPVHAHRSGTSRVNQIATVEDVSKQEQLHSASTALLNLLKSPACLLDSIGNIVHMNQSWRERAHFASPKSKSMSWVQSIWPEDRHIAISHIRSITATRRKTDFTCRLWNDAETARWYLLSLQPATDIAADEHQWLCIATDIQALKSREAELEHRLSIQTDMLDISVDCIKLIAIDGTVGHMNKAGCRALGIPDKSSFGMPWLPLLPSDVWAAGEEALNEARAGKFSRFPGRSVLPGETPQYWDNMLTPVMGPNGRPSMVLCVSREVTTERLAQEALRQSEERLKPQRRSAASVFGSTTSKKIRSIAMKPAIKSWDAIRINLLNSSKSSSHSSMRMIWIGLPMPSEPPQNSSRKTLIARWYSESYAPMEMFVG
jgi:PAS domain-containing protein